MSHKSLSLFLFLFAYVFLSLRFLRRHQSKNSLGVMDTHLEMIDKLWNRHVPDVPNVYIEDKHMYNYLLIFFCPGRSEARSCKQVILSLFALSRLLWRFMTSYCARTAVVGSNQPYSNVKRSNWIKRILLGNTHKRLGRGWKKIHNVSVEMTHT